MRHLLKQKPTILLMVLVMTFGCKKSSKSDDYLGSWVPVVDETGNVNGQDTLKISRIGENIFVEMGGQSLIANVDDKNNRLDFEVSAMLMHAKLSIVYVSSEDALWLTGGANGKTIFKRAN